MAETLSREERATAINRALELPEHTTHLKTDEVATYFRMSITTISEWVRENQFPNAYKLGKYWYIPISDILDKIDAAYGPSNQEAGQ